MGNDGSAMASGGGFSAPSAPRGSFAEAFAREHMAQGAGPSGIIYRTFDHDNDNSFAATFAREHMSLGSAAVPNLPWNSRIHSKARADSRNLRSENAAACPNSGITKSSSKIKENLINGGVSNNDAYAIILSSGKHGRDVVDAVLNIVKNTPFADIYDFMLHIAKAESNYGDNKLTFRDGYHGGIWQVDKIGFEETKNVQSHPSLKKHHQSIEKCFGIKWSEVKRQDLKKPLHSYIAARLLLLTKPGSIPQSIPDQAQCWKKDYNTEAGKGSIKHFIDANQAHN